MTRFISAIIDFIHPSAACTDNGHDSRPPYWVTIDGKSIHIKKLGNVHIDRIITWLDTLDENIAEFKMDFPATYSEEHDKIEMWKVLLEDEMQRRATAGIYND